MHPVNPTFNELPEWKMQIDSRPPRLDWNKKKSLLMRRNQRRITRFRVHRDLTDGRTLTMTTVLTVAVQCTRSDKLSTAGWGQPGHPFNWTRRRRCLYLFAPGNYLAPLVSHKASVQAEAWWRGVNRVLLSIICQNTHKRKCDTFSRR